MDLHMLAVAFPFLLFAFSHAVNVAFSTLSLDVIKVLITLLLGLLLNSGINEAYRIRENYALAGEPHWRAVFGLDYRDLRNTSSTSRALMKNIGAVPASSLILTDYRALYIRYLIGSQVYSPPPGGDCTRWKTNSEDGLLLIASPELPTWATDCLKAHPDWRLLRPDLRPRSSTHAG